MQMRILKLAILCTWSFFLSSSHINYHSRRLALTWVGSITVNFNRNCSTYSIPLITRPICLMGYDWLGFAPVLSSAIITNDDGMWNAIGHQFSISSISVHLLCDVISDTSDFFFFCWIWIGFEWIQKNSYGICATMWF